MTALDKRHSPGGLPGPGEGNQRVAEVTTGGGCTRSQL